MIHGDEWERMADGRRFDGEWGGALEVCASIVSRMVSFRSLIGCDELMGLECAG